MHCGVISVKEIMQFLCPTVAVLFTITFGATQRASFNAMESLFTLNVSSEEQSQYPFCAWPANITTDECNKNISLLCMMHNCSHGARVNVGNQTYIGAHGLKTSCVNGMNSGAELANGILIAHLTLNISDIAQNWRSNKPIPMYCATGDHQSKYIAYLSILNDCHGNSTSSTSNSKFQTLAPSSSIPMTISTLQSHSTISSTSSSKFQTLAPSSSILMTISPTPTLPSHSSTLSSAHHSTFILSLLIHYIILLC